MTVVVESLETVSRHPEAVGQPVVDVEIGYNQVFNASLRTLLDPAFDWGEAPAQHPAKVTRIFQAESFDGYQQYAAAQRQPSDQQPVFTPLVFNTNDNPEKIMEGRPEHQKKFMGGSTSQYWLVLDRPADSSRVELDRESLTAIMAERIAAYPDVMPPEAPMPKPRTEMAETPGARNIMPTLLTKFGQQAALHAGVDISPYPH